MKRCITCLFIFSLSCSTFIKDESKVDECTSQIFTEFYQNDLKFSNQSERITTPATIHNLENYNCIDNAAFFLIHISNKYELNEFMQDFTCKWETQTKFLIICGKCIDIQEFFPILWSHFIVNVMVINDTISYTYNPINDNCGKDIISTVIPMDCRHWISFSVEVSQYYNCDVKVAAVTFPPHVINPDDDKNPGYEIDALREVSRTLNFSIKYIDSKKAKWGVRLPNGSYTNSLNMLFEKQADLMLGTLLPNDSYMEHFSPTICYTYIYLNFYSPRARPIQGWQTIFLAFDYEVWSLFVISAVCTAFLWKYIAIVMDEDEEYRSLAKCALKIWCVIFSTFNAHPRSYILNEMFVFWSVYCFIMSSTFQSVLISFLTKPTYEKQISNVRELVESDLSYGGFHLVRDYFNTTLNIYSKKVFENWIYCPFTEECLYRAADERDFAAYKSNRYVSYISSSFVDSEGRSKLYKFKENQILHMWMLFTKHFPLRARFDKILSLLLQAGLIEKWADDAEHAVVNVQDSKPTVPLTIKDLKLAFVLFFFGLALSFFGFLYELYKWKQSCSTLQQKCASCVWGSKRKLDRNGEINFNS